MLKLQRKIGLLPVQSNAEHAVLPEGSEEEVGVLPAVPERGQRPLGQGDLDHPGQDLLQLTAHSASAVLSNTKPCLDNLAESVLYRQPISPEHSG